MAEEQEKEEEKAAAAGLTCCLKVGCGLRLRNKAAGDSSHPSFDQIQ